jgi:hypothetical protein
MNAFDSLLNTLSMDMACVWGDSWLTVLVDELRMACWHGIAVELFMKNFKTPRTIFLEYVDTPQKTFIILFWGQQS